MIATHTPETIKHKFIFAQIGDGEKTRAHLRAQYSKEFGRQAANSELYQLLTGMRSRGMISQQGTGEHARYRVVQRRPLPQPARALIPYAPIAEWDQKWAQALPPRAAGKQESTERKPVQPALEVGQESPEFGHVKDERITRVNDLLVELIPLLRKAARVQLLPNDLDNRPDQAAALLKTINAVRANLDKLAALCEGVQA